MKINRVNESYAWGDCEKARVPNRLRPTGRCENTVKFSDDGSHGVCPACSTVYVCHDNTAKIIGHIEHVDDYDKGTLKLAD